MGPDFEVTKGQITVGEWQIHIVQSARNGSLAPFKSFDFVEFSHRSDRLIDLGSPRCQAYRDAYAMIFMAANGEQIPICGDMTVLHNLIDQNYLLYSASDNKIEIGDVPLATKCFGLRHQNGDDTWYQAFIDKK